VQVKNKHTGETVNITEQGWQTLADLGFQSGWQLISRDDKPEQKIPVKKIKKWKT
jgi:hypothetical protein